MMGYKDRTTVSELVGKTLTKITNADNEQLIFECEDGSVYKMLHYSDCCESVTIEDIVGSFEDLIGTPILDAREETFSGENPKGVQVPEYQDSFTWTFYIFRTIKGTVNIRWYGESNGYYSESVDFERVNDDA